MKSLFCTLVKQFSKKDGSSETDFIAILMVRKFREGREFKKFQTTFQKLKI